MAEVAYFIRKAKQQLDYARFAIENSDHSFSAEALAPVDNKVAEIGQLIIETRRAIEIAEARILEDAQDREEREQETKQ